MTHFPIPSLLLMLSLTAGQALAGDSAIPEAWPAERYATMSRRSPFALATAAPVAAAPQASFATNWFVGGIGRVGDVDYVSIRARDLSAQFSLFGHEPNPENGVELAEVQWSEVVGRSTVILRKGNETARLEFNEAELRNPTPANKPGEVKKTAASSNAGFGSPAAKPIPGIRTDALPPLPTAAISTETTAQNTRRRLRPIGSPQ